MPYNKADMRTMFWRLTGRQDESRLSYLVIDGHLESGAVMVAEELELPERTDETTIPLEAGVYNYILPSNVLSVKEVFWNGSPLEFGSTSEWRHNNIAYRNATSGNPEKVAIEARTLYVYQPPSADAITTDAELLIRAVLAQGALTEAGIPGFSDADVVLAVYAGVLEYLAFNNHGGQFDRLIKSASEFYAAKLELAKIRYAEMLHNHNPTMNVVTGRTGPSR